MYFIQEFFLNRHTVNAITFEMQDTCKEKYDPNNHFQNCLIKIVVLHDIVSSNIEVNSFSKVKTRLLFSTNVLAFLESKKSCVSVTFNCFCCCVSETFCNGIHSLLEPTVSESDSVKEDIVVEEDISCFFLLCLNY